MNTELEDVIGKFGSLKEFTMFLREKINDGEQISKGKSPTEKSKEQKAAEQEAPAEPEGEEGMEPEVPVVDPVASPGSQISVGNKEVSKEKDPDSKKIEVGKEKDKVDMTPRIEITQ